MNVYPFLEAEKADSRNVVRACELLQVSRSAYYQQRDDQPTAREQSNTDLTALITELHTESKGRYGAPQIHAQLLRCGYRVARKRVARLMRAAGLRADGLGRFFTKIEGKASLPAFLSDHPPTAERQAKAQVGPEGAPAFTAAEWKALREVCQVR